MNELKPGDRVLIECEVDVKYLSGRVWIIPLKTYCATRTAAGRRPILEIDIDDIKGRMEGGLELGEAIDPQGRG